MLIAELKQSSADSNWQVNKFEIGTISMQLFLVECYFLVKCEQILNKSQSAFPFACYTIYVNVKQFQSNVKQTWLLF